jgi:SulP family sulfate permease
MDTKSHVLPRPPFEENGAAEEPELQQTPRSAGAWEFLCRHVPAFDSLRTYTFQAFRKDVLAGLTVAMVALPQAMAYATIAGLPPQYGLYTAIVMTAVGALFDSSKQLINGPTNAISIAVFSALSMVEGPEAKIQSAVLLALLVGLIQTGITLLRLGDLTRYVSQAVIVGFTLGAAILLVLSQIKSLLGVVIAEQSDHFLLRVGLVLRHLDQLHSWTCAIGIGTIVLVLALRWLNGRLQLPVPELLIAVVVMSVCVWLGELEQQGVRVVGSIPQELPSFELPPFNWTLVRNHAGSALAIALLGLLEAIAMAKVIAAQTGQKLDINQQCLSEGVANLAGSFFRCYPGSGSLTRSTINQQAGGISQWAGVFAALAVALTVLLLAQFAKYIPYAALAGILMVSAFRLVNWRQLHYHLRTTRFDAGIVVATALAAVIVSVEFCILIGVFLSFLLYVPRAARVQLTEFILTKDRVLRERLPEDPHCGRILIFFLEGELFFGSAPDLDQGLTAIAERALRHGVRVVVLRLKRVRNADAVCLALLDDFLKQMEGRGIAVFLCGVRGDLATVLRTSGIEARLGRRIFREVAGASSTLDAVRQAYDLLDKDLCPTCPRRDDSGAGKDVLYYMI